MVGDRIEIQDACIIVRIGIADGVEYYVIREIAVIEDIKCDFRLVERASRLRNLLRGATRKD